MSYSQYSSENGEFISISTSEESAQEEDEGANPAIDKLRVEVRRSMAQKNFRDHGNLRAIKRLHKGMLNTLNSLPKGKRRTRFYMRNAMHQMLVAATAGKHDQTTKQGRRLDRYAKAIRDPATAGPRSSAVS